MKLNARWHRSHRMPRNATPAQRLKWHLAHAKACQCRPLTADFKRRLVAAVAKRAGTGS